MKRRGRGIGFARGSRNGGACRVCVCVCVCDGWKFPAVRFLLVLWPYRVRKGGDVLP